MWADAKTGLDVGLTMNKHQNNQNIISPFWGSVCSPLVKLFMDPPPTKSISIVKNDPLRKKEDGCTQTRTIQTRLPGIGSQTIKTIKQGRTHPLRNHAVLGR